MGRISIATMMGSVVATAVATAALRDADGPWSGVLALMTVGLLGLAALNTALRSGDDRAAWLGFLFFAGGYWSITSIPLVSDRVEPGLATTRAFAYLHSRVAPAPDPSVTLRAQLMADRGTLRNAIARTSRIVRVPSDAALARLRNQLASLDSRIASLPAPASPPANRWRSLLPVAAGRVRFLRVGHDISALLAGCLGAALAARIRRREAARSRATGEQALAPPPPRAAAIRAASPTLNYSLATVLPDLEDAPGPTDPSVG